MVPNLNQAPPGTKPGLQRHCHLAKSRGSELPGQLRCSGTLDRRRDAQRVVGDGEPTQHAETDTDDEGDRDFMVSGFVTVVLHSTTTALVQIVVPMRTIIATVTTECESRRK